MSASNTFRSYVVHKKLPILTKKKTKLGEIVKIWLMIQLVIFSTARIQVVFFLMVSVKELILNDLKTQINDYFL